MRLSMEAGARGVVADRLVESLLHLWWRLESSTGAAAAAHEVVMVVSGELLDQLVAGELVAADHPVHHPHLLQEREVAVGRALRHTGVADQLARREGSACAREDS